MGNRHLFEMERLHTVGTPESGVLKVTALPSPERFARAGLNLFHPIASPLFKKLVFILRHNFMGKRGREGILFQHI